MNPCLRLAAGGKLPRSTGQSRVVLLASRRKRVLRCRWLELSGSRSDWLRILRFRSLHRSAVNHRRRVNNSKKWSATRLSFIGTRGRSTNYRCGERSATISCDYIMTVLCFTLKRSSDGRDTPAASRSGARRPRGQVGLGTAHRQLPGHISQDHPSLTYLSTHSARRSSRQSWTGQAALSSVSWRHRAGSARVVGRVSVADDTERGAPTVRRTRHSPRRRRVDRDEQARWMGRARRKRSRLRDNRVPACREAARPPVGTRSPA